MTITNQITRVVFTGVTAPGNFAIPFPFFEQEGLRVVLRETSTNLVTVLNPPADFTADPDTSMLTLIFPPNSSSDLIIERASEAVQESDYEDKAAIDAEQIERDFDRALMREQERLRDDKRTIRFPADDRDTTEVPEQVPNAELPNKADRADKFFKFDSDGNAVAVSVVTTDPTITVGAAGQTLLPLASLADWRNTLDVFTTGSGVLASIDADILSNRPAPAAANDGLFFATDTGQFFFSDGIAWTELGAVPRFALGSLPGVGDTGKLYLDTDRFHLHVDDGSAVRRVRSALPRGYIGGMNLSRLSTTELEISAGSCRTGIASNSDQDDALLSSDFSKLINASWASGDGNGGLASALALSADTWYHVFVLSNPNTGAVDAGFDTSIAAVNLLTDTAGSGLTKFRRVGSWLTNGSSELIQMNVLGEIFSFESPQDAVVAASADYTGADQLLILPVPPDVKVIATIIANDTATLGGGTGNRAAFRDGDATIGAVEPTEWTTTPMATLIGAGVDRAAQMELLTDTSQQIGFRTRVDTTVRLNVDVLRYQDFRGRFD